MTAVESHRPVYDLSAHALGNASPVISRVNTAPSQQNGKSAAEMKADGAAWRDAQPCTTTCACGEWQFTGTASDARAAFLVHLKHEHPELAGKKRRRNRHYSDRSPSPERDEAMVNVRTRGAAARASEERA